MSVSHSVFVDLAELWLPSQCARVCPQLHPGTKVEFICLGTWHMIKEGTENVPSQHDAQKERILGNIPPIGGGSVEEKGLRGLPSWAPGELGGENHQVAKPTPGKPPAYTIYAPSPSLPPRVQSQGEGVSQGAPGGRGAIPRSFCSIVSPLASSLTLTPPPPWQCAGRNQFSIYGGDICPHEPSGRGGDRKM